LFPQLPIEPMKKSGISHIVWWVMLCTAPVMLFLGGVGTFRLFQWAADHDDMNPSLLLNGLLLSVLPMVFCAFLAAALAVNFVRQKTLLSAQSAIAGLKNKQNYQQDFIRIIADNRPGATMIVDGEGRLWFVNAQAASLTKIPPQEAVGLSFEKTFPEADVLRLLPLIRRCRDLETTVEAVNKVTRGEVPHYVKSQVIPLPATSNMLNAVMINEDDITNLLVEREARERMFRQVIDTLVAVVDRRDPYAAGHSVRVGQMAKAIASEMKLGTAQIETAEIAGLLMNFGKVLVPREILTKASALTPQELQQVHASLLTSADILALIGFAQPVVPTLRQVLEHYDGSGIPGGLAGEKIMPTARVVMVANAFVALISARAHRPGLSVDAAVEALQKQSGRLYDPRVIESLITSVATQRHLIDWLPIA
jgi:HD-GYP domain-containing protein (c-di-GMP phosphodiesterase class II)